MRWRHPKARRIIVARSGAGAGVTIAIAEHAVRIDRGCRLIGDADDVDPFSRLHGILKMAADPLAAKGIEDVEADAIGPRRIIGRGLVIHTKNPVLLAFRALAHPVDVVRALKRWKGQHVRAIVFPTPGTEARRTSFSAQTGDPRI